MDKYNVVIIGGGPAGLTAGVYATRAGAKTLIIEKMSAGGKVNLTDNIENYMGFSEISGVELSAKMRTQAKKNGVKFIYDTALDINIQNKYVITENSGNIEYDALIIAGGTLNRKTGVTTEDRFIGAGVSYCAVCDGMFFKDKVVAVCGGGDTAVKDALYLQNICKKVYLIHRREGFRAEQALLDKLRDSDNIELVLNAVVSDIKGDKDVNAVEVTKKDGNKLNLEVSGLFVALGIIPDTAYLTGKITLDEGGYIVTNERMETNVKDIYAAGDIRAKSLRQIVTACADGAIAGDEATLGMTLSI